MTDLDPMAGVTDTQITVPVSAGQFNQLVETAIQPGRPRITHKVGVGPFAIPGLWVVVGAKSRNDSAGDAHTITLARLED